MDAENGNNEDKVDQNVEEIGVDEGVTSAENNVDGVDGKKYTVDGKTEGKVDERYFFGDRVDAPLFVEPDSPFYNMNHKRRGQCIIFTHETFISSGRNLNSRDCAKPDARLCEKTFRHLGFEVKTHFDLNLKELTKQLLAISKEDHSDSDCLVVIFMSHGNYNIGKKAEMLSARDADFLPSELWSNFTTNKCRTLAGKPKLFFIQACRGTKTDKGVHLNNNLSEGRVARRMGVEFDGPTEECVIPSPADIMVMWASYPGYYAWKSRNNGLDGSVFIHFLAKVLEEEGTKEEFSALQLTITRRVALDFESYSPKCYEMDMSKQIPYVESTLMRRLQFKPKC